jgi:hypothetical protein
VRREIERLFQRIAVLVVETTATGAENDTSSESSDSSGHVNGARASEINRADSKQRVNGGVGQKSVVRPEGMGDLIEAKQQKQIVVRSARPDNKSNHERGTYHWVHKATKEC